MKKIMSKKGFTLMEMLIVVAIIAILVAVAIPTFSNALTKAKESTDMANVRATYADIVMKNMLDAKKIPETKEDFGVAVKAATGKEMEQALNYPDKLTVGFANNTLTITYKCSASKDANGPITLVLTTDDTTK